MNRNIKAVPFHKPVTGRKEIKAVKKVLSGGWLTTGNVTLEFEKNFARFLNKSSPPYSLAVNSATAGIHLALEACGVSENDFVALPTMTFTAAAEVIIHLGGIPVFIDSEPETGNMDWRHLDKILRNNKNIAEKLKAVIPVHLAGYPMDMDPIRDIIPDYTVIIEDSAHAFPSFTEKGPAGLLGDIGVFSFYATKTITTGEGGMVVTRNKRFYERIKLMRLHGIDRTVWNRYSSSAGSRAWEYDVLAPGYKYNLTDIASAIGNEQLNIALKLLDKRKKISEIYIKELSDIKELQLPPSADGHAWHLFILRLGSSDKRDFLALKLKENNIGSSVHFIPLHKMTYWKNEFHLEEKDYPEAEKFFAGAISIPIWPGLRWKDQKRIIKIIRENINE